MRLSTGVWVLPLLLSGWCSQLMAEDRPEVRIESVDQTELFAEVSLSGTVNPMRSSGISVAVAGLIDQVAVEPGSEVDAGELLIGLDDEQAALALQQSAALLEEGRVALAEAQRRLDEARSVGVGRNIAATEISTRENAVAAAVASVRRLEAERDQAEVLLRRHRILAPFDGVVSQRLRDLGEWVSPGDELVRLVDTKNLRLDFQVPQAQYQAINAQAGLWLMHQDQAVQARIDALVPVSDSASRTFLLRAVAPDSVVALPGMAVQATLRTTTGQQGLTVPRDAINRYPDGRVTVWLALPTEQSGVFSVTEKRIQLGAAFDGRVAVTDGLQADQQIVTRGNELLSEGLEVQLSAQGEP